MILGRAIRKQYNHSFTCFYAGIGLSETHVKTLSKNIFGSIPDITGLLYFPLFSIESNNCRLFVMGLFYKVLLWCDWFSTNIPSSSAKSMRHYWMKRTAHADGVCHPHVHILSRPQSRSSLTLMRVFIPRISMIHFPCLHVFVFHPHILHLILNTLLITLFFFFYRSRVSFIFIKKSSYKI